VGEGKGTPANNGQRGCVERGIPQHVYVREEESNKAGEKLPKRGEKCLIWTGDRGKRRPLRSQHKKKN